MLCVVIKIFDFKVVMCAWFSLWAHPGGQLRKCGNLPCPLQLLTLPHSPCSSLQKGDHLHCTWTAQTSSPPHFHLLILVWWNILDPAQGEQSALNYSIVIRNSSMCANSICKYMYEELIKKYYCTSCMHARKLLSLFSRISPPVECMLWSLHLLILQLRVYHKNVNASTYRVKSPHHTMR